jgi:DNA-binding NarL/FixJ family response regulator
MGLIVPDRRVADGLAAVTGEAEVTKGNFSLELWMPPTSPDTVVLTDADRADLDRMVRAGRTEQRLAQRAGIVLAAADGQSNTRIAASLGVCEGTARKRRHR